MAALIALGVAVAYLGWTLVAQDREIAARRAAERLGSAADLAVAAIDRSLGTIEEHLATIAESTDIPRAVAASGLLDPDAPTEALVFVATPANTWSSSPLLYDPQPVSRADRVASDFVEAERLEFADGRLAEAVPMLEALAVSPTPELRAGALARLGRVRRKLGQPAAALQAYAALGRIGSAMALGRPADLVAVTERCSLLDEAGQAATLAQAVDEFERALFGGRWRLSRAEFEFHRLRVDRWRKAVRAQPMQQARAKLTAGATLAWQAALSANGSEGSTRGRQLFTHDGQTGVLVWRRGPSGVSAFVATAARASQIWQTDLSAIETRHHVRISAGDEERLWTSLPPMNEVVERPSKATGLPVTIAVANGDLNPDAADRRPFIGIIAAVAAVVLLGGYLSGRGLSRELAAVRLQSDFVSAVSHEFRTPVASVRQLSELLDEGRVTDEARRSEYYGLLRREGIRLQRLVENLLDFGRMEAGAAEYRMESLDPEAFLEELVRDFREEVRLSGRVVELSVSRPLPAVHADREALGRAVWNLLDNAAKYSPPETPVEVDVRAAAAGIVIRVHDQGPGIPADEQRRIFDKFVRGADARSSGAKGTGLGLAMVKHIVAAHGGTIRVESEPGRGSTFVIELALDGVPARSIEKRVFA